MSLPSWLTATNALIALGALSGVCTLLGPALVGLGLPQAGHFVSAIGLDLKKLGQVLQGLYGAAEKAVEAPKAAGFARVRFLVFLTVLVGCATLKTWWNTTVDCAKHDSADLLASLPKVLEALAQRDYVSALDQVGADVGEVYLCDVAALSAPPSGQASIVGVSSSVQSNAAQYIAQKGVAVVNVQPIKR